MNINYINQTDLNEGLVAPSTMGVDDPLLSKLVVSLTDLILEKQRLSSTLTPQSPKMKELLGQMETIRNQIKESLKNIQEVSQIISSYLFLLILSSRSNRLDNASGSSRPRN